MDKNFSFLFSYFSFSLQIYEWSLNYVLHLLQLSLSLFNLLFFSLHVLRYHLLPLCSPLFFIIFRSPLSSWLPLLSLSWRKNRCCLRHLRKNASVLEEASARSSGGNRPSSSDLVHLPRRHVLLSVQDSPEMKIRTTLASHLSVISSRISKRFFFFIFRDFCSFFRTRRWWDLREADLEGRCDGWK